MASNRNINEQFGAGIDISGSRIQHALEDLLARMNQVDPSLVQRRWVETHMVSGFIPSILNPPVTASQLPWLRAYNPRWLSGVEVPDAADIKNAWRSKCAWIDGADPRTGTGELWTYELSMYITKPTILSSLAITLAVDSDYANAFQYGANPPDGYTTGDSLQDFTVNVTVDSNLDGDDRSKTSVEAVNYRAAMDRSNISQITNVVTDAFNPHHPDGAVTGIMVELPVGALFPEQSRVRIEVIIPQYNTNPTTAVSWKTDGFVRQVLSTDLCLFEVCEV